MDGLTNTARHLDVPIPASFGLLATATAAEDMFVDYLNNVSLQNFSRSFWMSTVADSFQGAYARSKLGELFCILGEGISNNPQIQERNLTFKRLKQISEAKLLIDSAGSEVQSVESIAAHVGMNRRDLIDGFKRVHGLTVSQYASERKLHHARLLLLETSIPIIEVALEAGYSHHSSFSRAFTQSFGKTPQQVRKDRC